MASVTSTVLRGIRERGYWGNGEYQYKKNKNVAAAVVDLWRGWRGGGEDEEGEEVVVKEEGGGTSFWGYVLDMRQPLQEHGAQGLFEVEIGQFESVSFNFSQFTGPPWVPHIPLIGYKLVFFFCPLTPSVFKHLFFSFSFTHYPGTPVVFFFPAPSSSSLLNGVAVSPPMFVKQSVISIKLHLCCL